MLPCVLVCVCAEPNQPLLPTDLPKAKHKARKDIKAVHSTAPDARPPKSAAKRQRKTSSEGTPEPKRKRRGRPPASGSKSMWVSIDCSHLPAQPNLVSGSSSSMRVTKKRAADKPQKTAEEEGMIVRVERRKLRGALGAKAWQPPPPARTDVNSAEGSFMMMAEPSPTESLPSEIV